MEGYGTETNIYKLLLKMEELRTRNNGKKKWILFIDFAKAYDLVNHHILFEKMKKMKIKQEVIDGVKMMFNNLVIQVAD